ncbi:MAG: hypothetical protein STSR0004_19960 [Peptococcaceae bacterium]
MKKPILKRYQKMFLSVTAFSLFFLLCFALVVPGTGTLGWGSEKPNIELSVNVGETIVTITGTTDDSLNGQRVTLELKGPNNNRIAVEQETIQNGRFEWQIHRNTFTVAGKYTVYASVGASPVQAEAPRDSEIFEIPSPAPSPDGGGGGGGGGGPSCLEVEKLTPAKDASNVALDEGVSVTFKKEVEAVSATDLAKITIKDAKGNAVGEVKATVKDKKLNIEHDKFAYKTKYNVTIPEKCVKDKTSSLYNCKIEWSFTTKEELITGCEFKDLTKEHWAYECITKLCQQNIVAGYPDKTFRPGNNITRAEFAKLIVGALGLAKEMPGKPTFMDVQTANWHYGYVEAAAKAGLVKGYKGKFRPNDFITRQEITAIMIRAMGKESEALAKAQEKIDLADAAQISSWARGYVALAVTIGLLEGYPDKTFMPKKNTTRAEAAIFICRYLEKSKK